jgi:mRNA interferase MazF
MFYIFFIDVVYTVFMNNFDEWIKEKKALHDKKNFAFCKTQQIWWCEIGQNVGVEINGKNSNFERPVLILKIFNTEMIFVVPLTTQKKDNPYYIKLKDESIEKYAVLSQARLISARRLVRKITKIDNEEFKNIKHKFKSIFE